MSVWEGVCTRGCPSPPLFYFGCKVFPVNGEDTEDLKRRRIESSPCVCVCVGI